MSKIPSKPWLAGSTPHASAPCWHAASATLNPQPLPISSTRRPFSGPTSRTAVASRADARPASSSARALAGDRPSFRYIGACATTSLSARSSSIGMGRSGVNSLLRRATSIDQERSTAAADNVRRFIHHAEVHPRQIFADRPERKQLSTGKDGNHRGEKGKTGRSSRFREIPHQYEHEHDQAKQGGCEAHQRCELER